MILREELLHDACLRNDSVLVQKIITFANFHGHVSRQFVPSSLEYLPSFLLQTVDREGARYPCLVECARRGHKESLIVLMQQGYNIEAVDKMGMTALLIAAWSGKKDIVDLLIHVGANCLAVNRSGETALHLAAKSEQIDILAYLLTQHSHRFNVNARDKDGRTALHILAGNGDIDSICLMIQAGAHVNLKDNVSIVSNWFQTWLQISLIPKFFFIAAKAISRPHCHYGRI